MIALLQEKIGRAVSWLSLFLVLGIALVVLLRYGFDISLIWLSELVQYAHAVLFLLSAGYVWQENGHVRVDIFYQRMSERGRHWVNGLGALLLVLPFSVAVIWLSMPFITNSWAIWEGSRELDGMPGVFLLKTAIWLFALLVGAQAVVAMRRSYLGLQR